MIGSRGIPGRGSTYPTSSQPENRRRRFSALQMHFVCRMTPLPLKSTGPQRPMYTTSAFHLVRYGMGGYVVCSSSRSGSGRAHALRVVASMARVWLQVLYALFANYVCPSPCCTAACSALKATKHAQGSDSAQGIPQSGSRWRCGNKWNDGVRWQAGRLSRDSWRRRWWLLAAAASASCSCSFATVCSQTSSRPLRRYRLPSYCSADARVTATPMALEGSPRLPCKLAYFCGGGGCG